MTRQDFIEYLEANGCEIVRVANQGYHVMRNKSTLKISGVPVTDPPLSATVCRICKTLEVHTPDESKASQSLIDHIHDKYNSGGN
jgi:hypothetical protein